MSGGTVNKATMMWAYSGLVAVLVVVLSASTTGERSEAVHNPSAVDDLSDWVVETDGTEPALRRVHVPDAPGRVGTAVEVRRSAEDDPGSYTHLLVGLRDPESFFDEGSTYRMRVTVRDLGRTGRSAGVMLGNTNLANRPTTASAFGGFRDRRWHVLQATFVASSSGRSDTALYIELPNDGALHWQLTRASVRKTDLPTPPSTATPPAEVLAFDGSRGDLPDPRTWTTETGGEWGDNELQTYTRSEANASVDGAGHLVVTVRREDAVGPDGVPRQYTSARLTTHGKYSVPPGSYVEAAVRLPTGVGLRPAFWLLGSDLHEVGWPASGELDVVEASQRGDDVVSQAIHVSRRSDPTEDAPYGEYAPGGHTTLPADRDEGFHRYGVYFDRRLVQFYVNGETRLRLTAVEARGQDRRWPFGRPMDIILNVAVAGDTVTSDLPATMSVSAIHIWHGGVPVHNFRHGSLPVGTDVFADRRSGP